MRSLACFVGVGGEGWAPCIMAQVLVQPPKSPACRRGLTSRIIAQVLVQPLKSLACRRGMHHASWRMVFGAAAEVSCLSERATSCIMAK